MLWILWYCMIFYGSYVRTTQPFISAQQCQQCIVYIVYICMDIVEQIRKASQFCNWSLSQGKCREPLLRRHALPQNLFGRRGTYPCCHLWCNLSQVKQLFPEDIHCDEIYFSIFKKRKRTSFYPRLAVAYSLIVLIIIIRLVIHIMSEYIYDNIQVLWLLGNKHFPKDVAESQDQVCICLLNPSHGLSLQISSTGRLLYIHSVVCWCHYQFDLHIKLSKKTKSFKDPT